MCSPHCRVWFHSTIWLVETDRLSCDQRVDGGILNSPPRGQTGLFHLYLRLLMASLPTCPKSPRPLAASEATSLISASFAFRLISCICDRMPALGEKLENSNHSAAGIGKPGFRMRRPNELERSRVARCGRIRHGRPAGRCDPPRI